MVYAMPAFSGYLTEWDVNLLQAVINKAFKLGYLFSIPDLRSLISRADRQLFNKLNTNPQHCLAPLLPPERSLETRSTLRARGHRFSLPQCKSKLLKMRILIVYYSCIFILIFFIYLRQKFLSLILMNLKRFCLFFLLSTSLSMSTFLHTTGITLSTCLLIWSL